MVDGFKHGLLFIQQTGLVLSEVADFYIVSQRQGSRVRNLAQDTLDQGGFTLPVLAHEGHFLSSADGQVDVFEHGVTAVILA